MAIDPHRLTPGQLKILQAVVALLENPANKITIQRIAKEIHVTEGAIYRHYRSKDDIFETIMSYMESNLIAPLNAAQQQGTKTYTRLENVFSALMTFLDGHPGLARLLLGHGATEAALVAERLKIINGKMRAQVAQMLKFGLAQGELKDNLTAEQMTELFYGLIAGAAMVQAYDMPQVGTAARWQVFAQAIFTEDALKQGKAS